MKDQRLWRNVDLTTWKGVSFFFVVCLFICFVFWLVCFLGYGVSLSFYSALFTLNTYC